MGTSTNAILCWGIPFEDEEQKPEFLGEHDELDVLIRVEAGISDWSPDLSAEECDLYWQSNREARDAYPVELVMHCSCKCPMYILAPKGCVIEVLRGDAHEVNGKDIHPTTEQLVNMRAWCEAHNVEWKQPKLLLCSLWC